MAGVWRIRDRATFDALRRSGRRARLGPLSITWLPGRAGAPPRVAYAVGRSTGGAVARNRLRRRLRAVVANDLELASGAYLFSADSGAASLSWDELRATARATARAVIEQQFDNGPVAP